MEPKDLKNPKGLKSTEILKNEISGKETVSNEPKQENPQAEESEKVNKPDIPAEESLAQEPADPAEEISETNSESGIEERREEPADLLSTDEPTASVDSKDDSEDSAEDAGDEQTEDEEAPKAAEELAEADEEEESPKAAEDAAEADAAEDTPRAEEEPAEADEAEETPKAEEEPVEADAAEDTPKAEEEPAEADEAEETPKASEDTDESVAAEEPAPEAVEEQEKASEPTPETAAKPSAKDESRDVKKKEATVQSKPKPEERKIPDYTTFSQIELVNALRDLVNSNGDHDIKEEVDAVKAAFYQQVKEEVEEQKKNFLEEGGNEDEFNPEENPYEQDIKDLLKQYRQQRHEFNKKLDYEKDLNLQVKYEIIEDIKGLIHKEESINKTFQDFRDLQQRWREVGLVPQAKMKDLWDTYHFHVENFYDYIKINKELRDLDLKKNLEMKIRLCEQAEELLFESNTVKAFNQLQKLHERWREIGPVPRENKDDLWDRFKASTAKINKKHQEYFEIRKQEQRENLEAKRALCEQVEDVNQLEISSHKDWAEKSKEVINLQKVWRTIGFAPRKENNRIYKRFREACDAFFDAKREFYSKNKELQQQNLQLKTELCMQAEALKESTDWSKTTQDIINIQKQWKEIGPIPRKNSDALWKRFREACDYFFEKKSEHFSTIDSEQVDNLKKKEELINDVETYTPSEDPDQNLTALKDFQRRWTEIGHVPIRKKEEVQKRFRDGINKLFDDLDIDESKRNLIKFRTKIASISESSRGQNKMRMERDKYMMKLKQLESDLVLLDNNIGFFAKSKNAEKLIRDVNRKIDQTKEKIEFLKNKIRVIDEMDHSDE